MTGSSQHQAPGPAERGADRRQAVFVGDIQGCHAELDALLSQLENRFGRDGFVLHLVGDLVNRGPGSLHVLDRIHRLWDEDRAQVVLGNHELHFLMVAFELRKLGERFLWVGSDGQAWWIFELMADPVRLVVLPPGETGGFSVGPGKGLLNPDRLLHLAGLLPYDRIDEDTLGFDDQGRVRFITVSDAESGWRRTRWHLDSKTLLPAEIVALNDDDGEVLATARLSAYEPIAGRDMPLGAWPQFPRKVYLTLADDGADVRLFFNRPSARGTGIRPRLFDLEQLMKTFRPGEVEYVSR